MWMLAGYRLRRAAAVLLQGVACAVVLVPLPCSADLGPQAAILVSVDYEYPRPRMDFCWTQATSCDQIIRSTSAEGDIGFTIYYMTGQCWAGRLQSFVDTMTWPPAWQLVDMTVCGPGYGSLDADGTIWMTWDDYETSPDYEGVVPLAVIWFHVDGPGRLGFVHDYGEVRLQGYTCLAWEVYAEAGMQCGHISPHCAYNEWACDITFETPELVLTAPVGGSADSTIQIDPSTFSGCRSFVIDTHATWCTAAVVESLYVHLWRLNVGVDATGLFPGRYDTWVELSNANWGVSRCLPVGLLVEPPIGTEPTSWGQAKTLYR